MSVMRTGFAEIKNRFNAADYLRRIDPQAILDHYGARNQTQQRNGKDGTAEIVHSCLLDQVERHHANGDENPSAAMNLDKATYACYGYWMGGIFEFVMKMEQKEHLHDIVAVLAQFVGDSEGPDQPAADEFIAKLTAVLRADPRGARTAVRAQQYNERAIGAWVGVRHPYATEERGLADRAYERLHLGYDAGTGRLVFPHYVGGKLLGWQQRAIPDRPGLWPGSAEQLPKYRSNSSFPKSSTLYNVDNAGLPGAPIVVVESPMSVAWAVGQGQDNLVALFGASVPAGQLDALRELGPLVLWLDGDPAGYKAERRICEALMRTNEVRVVIPTPGKDLADCESIGEVQERVAKAKPAVLRMIDYARGIR